MTVSEAEIAELRKLAEAATPGPWEARLGIKWSWIDAPGEKTWVADCMPPAPKEGETDEQKRRFALTSQPVTDIICPECHGERRIGGHLCRRCHGTAQIRSQVAADIGQQEPGASG